MMRGASPIDRVQNYLGDFVTQAEPVWQRYWDEKAGEMTNHVEWARRAAEQYRRLIQGGKHLRAALVTVGWRMAGRTDLSESVILASGSVETLHNAFLIHDDIVDNSDLRRSQPTVHKVFRDDAMHRGLDESRARALGTAIALNVGDLGQALAQEMLMASPGTPSALLSCVQLFNEYVQYTVIGQMLDVADISLTDLTEEYVLRVHRYKTAYYTIVLPMAIGYVLGVDGPLDDNTRSRITEYGLPLGIAFQLQDDVLGLFGSEAVLGKSVDSDIKEGKKTLLFVKAFELAGEKDRARLLDIHGNPGATEQDLEFVRGLVRSCGALDHSDRLAASLAETAKGMAGELDCPADVHDLLVGFCDYMISRDV